MLSDDGVDKNKIIEAELDALRAENKELKQKINMRLEIERLKQDVRRKNRTIAVLTILIILWVFSHNLKTVVQFFNGIKEILGLIIEDIEYL